MTETMCFFRSSSRKFLSKMESRKIVKATSNETLQQMFDIHEYAFRDSPQTNEGRNANLDHKRKEFVVLFRFSDPLKSLGSKPNLSVC